MPPGEDFEFELCIRAEDEEGNWGEKTLTLHAKRSEKGQKTGHTAQIYIDLGVLGLGTYGPVSYEILSGEPLSYVVAKVIPQRDRTRTVRQAMRPPPPVTGPASPKARSTAVFISPRSTTVSLPPAQKPSALISSRTAGPPSATIRPPSTTSTAASAWAQISPASGAASTKPRPAQQRPILFRWLSRRIQLHRGIRLDVHHRPDNRLPRPQPLQRILHQQRQRRPHPPLYARLWLGRRRPHGRQGQRRRGLLHHLGIRRLGRPRPQLLRRARCGRKLRLPQLRRSLLHELHHTAPHEWRALDDGEHHMEYCTSCKQPVTGVQESHEKTFTDNADGQTHTVQCSKCSYVFEAQSAHRWPTDEELAQQATRTEPVTLTLRM